MKAQAPEGFESWDAYIAALEGFDWLTDAADLLARDDPGPTPWLVEDLIVDQALVAAVGKWKTTKSYAVLDISVSVATGRPVFGALRVPERGSVFFINEESAEAALWRRLDALVRGRAIKPDELRRKLFVAANKRVRLDDLEWQKRLVDAAAQLQPRLVCLDPLARMKSAMLDENSQSEMAVLIEFVRQLRDATGAAVLFVHHTGHEGQHMRGSSDLESAWETRLEWKREGSSPEVTVKAEHREAESGGTVKYRIGWDGETRSMRFDLVEDSQREAIRQHLAEHPDASANDVFEAVGGNRANVLRIVKETRAEGGTNGAVPPEYHPPRTGRRVVPPRGPLGPSVPPLRALVPTPRYHPPSKTTTARCSTSCR